MKKYKNKNLNTQEVWQKLILILKPERKFYATAAIYSIGVSILTLGVPISVQALVNTVTFGVLVQPLIILSIVLLSLLIFSSTLNALQTYITEVFQRHFYTRTTVDMTVKLIEGEYNDLEELNSVKLVNRYFDVMTVQKSVTSLLTGGIDIVLQTFVGLILLAFYHPYFLVFDMILLFLLWLAWNLFWRRSAQTAVAESSSKYAAASWLEEIAKANLFFKTDKRKDYAFARSENYIEDYLVNREKHFKFYFLQNISLLAIYAVMSAFVLALGGFLVIEGELTLGQLVAAELIVTGILAGFSKSGKYLESFYDMYAAIVKISSFYEIDLEKEKRKVELNYDNLRSYDLHFDNVEVSASKYKHGHVFDYKFISGHSYFIHTEYYSSKLLLMQLAQKLITPDKGALTFGGHKFSEISASNLRDYIYVLKEPTILEGTIEENLVVGNPDISPSQINSALEVVELTHLYTTFEDGLSQKILPSGSPLWSSQLIRLEIARIILLKPKVVILTEVFDQVETRRRKKIMQYLITHDITVLLLSHRDVDEFNVDKYLSLRDNEFFEFDSKAQLDKFIKE